MKKVLFGVACAVCAAVVADGLTAPSRWFDETYQGLVESRPHEWRTSVGTWRADGPDDRSVFSNETKTIHFDTRGGEIRLQPKSSSAKNGAVSVTSRMTFTACRNGEEWQNTNSPPQAAIGMRLVAETEVLTFIGLKTTRDGSVIKFRWTDLSAPGVTPVEGVFYDVTIDSDYSCVPTRVRYSVNGTPLADANGETWFSSRGGSLDPASTAKLDKRATSVGFSGRGRVTAVNTTQRTPRASRATVRFNTLLRPRVGDVPTFTVTPNEGQTLAGDLSYIWYLVDAAGMPVEAPPRAVGPDYALTAADYGHWVAVDVSDAGGYAGTGRFWFSDLPVVEMTVGTAEGYTPTDDETAQTGVAYYWADEADVFTRLDLADGADLTSWREQYGRLFTVNRATEWPTSKKETHTGMITIRGNAEYANQLNNRDFTIHVRGNSTAGADKKPYKIKLGKKADLFGLGGGVKSKHWVLLANCYDESLMRNKLCYDLSGVFGCPAWMRSEWVDVVMNGQYVGNYLLCQHIRIGEERIPIHDWDGGAVAENAVAQFPGFLAAADEDEIDSLLETNCLWITSGQFAYGGTNFVLTATKKLGGTFDEAGRARVYWKAWNGGDASGGYVFEIDSKKVVGGSAPAPSNFIQANKTPYGTLNLCVAMNTPEYLFANASLSNYVWNVWWDLGQAWMRPEGYNTKGRHYTELADFNSMVAYWLAQYIPGNDDAGSYSRYSYMDVGGKMTFGPAWDFDYGLGSLQIRTRSAATTNADGRVSYAPIAPEKFIPGTGGNNFMGHWTADPYFTFKLYERYWATRGYLAEIVREGGLIDQYKAKIGISARANDLRWNNRIGFWGDADEPGDVEMLRSFLARRFAWFDRQFATAGAASTNLAATIPNAAAKLRYTRDGTLRPTFIGATANSGSVETDVVDVVTPLALAPLTATVAVPGGSTTALEVYVNGLFNGTYRVGAGRSAISIPAEALRTGETNVVAFIARRADGSIRRRNFALVACTLPTRVAAADGGHDVSIDWLRETWAAYRRVYPTTTLAPPVSYADYLGFATNASPYQKSVPLYYDYIAGTRPEKTGEFLTAGITMNATGEPQIWWRPDTPALRASRVYTLLGAPDLAGSWAETDAVAPADAFCRTNRFFKIRVELPSAR
ncbi:MAG: CotH kinase family protein [Kiritimatiellia bacterium]